MNNGIDICGFEAENAFLVHIFDFFGVSLFFRVGFEIVVDDAVERGIFDGSADLFSALNAFPFFAVN